MKTREKRDEVWPADESRLTTGPTTEPPDLVPGSAVMHWSSPSREVRGRWDVPRKEDDGAAASPPTLAEAPCWHLIERSNLLGCGLFNTTKFLQLSPTRSQRALVEERFRFIAKRQKLFHLDSVRIVT